MKNIHAMINEVFGDDSNRVRILLSGSRVKLEIKNMIHDGIWISSEQEAPEKIAALHKDMICQNISWPSLELEVIQ